MRKTRRSLGEEHSQVELGNELQLARSLAVMAVTER